MPDYLFIHFGFEVFFIFTLSIQNDKFKPGVTDFMSCYQTHLSVHWEGRLEVV